MVDLCPVNIILFLLSPEFSLHRDRLGDVLRLKKQGHLGRGRKPGGKEARA